MELDELEPLPVLDFVFDDSVAQEPVCTNKTAGRPRRALKNRPYHVICS